MAEIQRLVRPTIAVISIGEMGLGIAKLLIHHSYPVVTNLDGRSEITKLRAMGAGIHVLPLPELVSQSDIILSIVAPKDAMALGESIAEVAKSVLPPDSDKRIGYIDLNAISPRLATDINAVLKSPHIVFVDGCILNFPPKLLDDGSWFKPVLITSGPLSNAIPSEWIEDLATTLNIRNVNERIGPASGLKMCFASMFKGHVAIALQSYTTAQELGVLPELRSELAEQFPVVTETFDKIILGSQYKAYRWIKEIEEIKQTFSEEGGWSGDIFGGVADVFRVVAEREIEGLERHEDVEGFVREVCARNKRRKSI
jgi:3-hydroxyisobutyrate dehydrogenase-like beta-hydroxyacid dehydrogenase